MGGGGKIAPEKDGWGYEVFKKLDKIVLDEILALMNTVWQEGYIPASWKQAVVIPILKPGKEAKQSRFI